MPDISIQQLLAQAIQHHQAARLADAATLYQAILARDPRHADALRLLGVIAHGFQRHNAAVELLRQAIGVNPAIPEYHNDLGLALHALGEENEAAAAYRIAIGLRPGFAEAYYNLGNLHKAQRRHGEAVELYRTAIRLRPDYAEAHNNLGNVWIAMGRVEDAIQEFRAAALLQPRKADVRANLANALQTNGQFREALPEYRDALALAPGDARVHRHFADALQSAGRFAEAIAEYQIALELDRNQPAALNNLGTALKSLNRHDEAAAQYRAALALQPDYAEALSNLGSTLKDQGALEEAVACFRRAAQADPESVDVASNLAYMVHFDPAYGPQEIAAELARWNSRFAAPLLPGHPVWQNDRSPERPLRIGWVSPDFRRHPIGRFLLPLFAAHDATHFPFYCYSDVVAEDETTTALRAHAQRWQNTTALPHDRLAELICADQIDILIDLTMHMQKTRLLAFARKPASLQMSYLAYASSTGMPAIDYRLTDAAIEAGGTGEAYVEKPLTLQSYWCYEPDPAAPPVSPPPSDKNGFITFGNLNNFCKASGPALEAWAAILGAVPKSRLILHAAPGSHRSRVLALLAARGVSAERCRFVDMLPFDAYLRLYHEIDIALDPFPYAGGTTSCDALWMGVPLLTLAGRTGVGRGGASLLTQLDLAQFIAHDASEYTRQAVALANDATTLRALRGSLRERMSSSRLTDRHLFAADLQNLLRHAWRGWCSRPGT